MKNARWFVVAVLIAGVVPQLASAHFRLLEPPSWLVENQLGDPQKLAPCGGTSASPGTPSGIVTAVTGGSKIPVKLMETIYHPGFYRIALAVKSRDELPPDPVAVTKDSARGPWSVSGAIQSNPQPPVLADGLFLHRAKPSVAFEVEVQLPNLTCEKCTLQVIEFMEDHGFNKDGGYTYHHCADLKITADPAKPIDKGWPGQG